MDTDQFLAHYGVKGMKKGVRSEQGPSADNNFMKKNANGEWVQDMDALRKHNRSFGKDEGVSSSATPQQAFRKLLKDSQKPTKKFIDNLFDRKINTMRGKNASSRVKQGQVNKFMDKLFKQKVRKRKK
jgi:hypothetical protein